MTGPTAREFLNYTNDQALLAYDREHIHPRNLYLACTFFSIHYQIPNFSLIFGLSGLSLLPILGWLSKVGSPTLFHLFYHRYHPITLSQDQWLRLSTRSCQIQPCSPNLGTLHNWYFIETSNIRLEVST